MSEPPKWVLDKLEEIHPLCRLGYGGGLRDDEVGIIELWRVREAPTTILGEPFLGRVFGSSYDPVERVPLLVMSARMSEVVSGEVIDAVRQALSSFKERATKARIEQGRLEEEKLRELAEEMGDRVWFESQKTGAPRGTIVPDECITSEERAVATGEYAEQHSRETHYLPTHEGVPVK